MKVRNHIVRLIALFLVWASIGNAVPWISIQQNLFQFAFNSEEEDQEQAQSSDDEDSKDDREEREDGEERFIDKDFLAMKLQLVFYESQKSSWKVCLEQGLSHPNFDILLPPPKTVC